METITSLDHHWLWLIAAALLATAEIIVPGVFLIWLGFAALLTGLVTWAIDIPVAAQFGLFAAGSIVSVWLGRRFFLSNPIASTDPMLNDRVARMIGEIVIAVEPVDDAHGRVKVGDSVWSARGDAAAPGDRLRVTGIEKGILLVERA